MHQAFGLRVQVGRPSLGVSDGWDRSMEVLSKHVNGHHIKSRGSSEG